MKQSNDYLSVDIQIEESKWGFSAEELFSLVIRKNKKRHFLFASKVIGKYISVHPYRPILISAILAATFYESVEGKKPEDLERLLGYWQDMPSETAFYDMIHTKYKLNQSILFIGFAETATGLGHGVFSRFDGRSAYLHTTRANLVEESPDLVFKEEHSHAVGHYCFGRKLNEIKSYDRVVLIDDEITTGNTALNLIRALFEAHHITSFTVLSLLDWREEEHIRKFEALEEELGIQIQCVTLLKGQIKTKLLKNMDNIELNNELIKWQEEDNALEKEKEAIKRTHLEAAWDTIYLELDHKVTCLTKGNDGKIRRLDYLEKATGRFGLWASEQEGLEDKFREMGQFLAQYRNYPNALCLGTEELIYIPCMIASYMGENIKFACSARSPIITMPFNVSHHSEYALTDAICFSSPEDEALRIYLYNMKGQGYQEIFWFLERDMERTFKERIVEALVKCEIKKVHFVVFNSSRKGEDHGAVH